MFAPRGFIAVTPVGSSPGLINVSKILSVSPTDSVNGKPLPEGTKSVIVLDPANKNLHPEPMCLTEEVDTIAILISKARG